MKSASALFAAFFSALILAVVATGFQAKQVKRVMPCVGEDCITIHRSVWVNTVKRSRRRLLGWRKAERERNKAREAARSKIYSVPFGNSWLDSAFLCIHHFEGPWNANTGNGFENGLQMDRAFQRTYGVEFFRLFGPAWRWPAAVQIAVAEKASASGRKFYPWPNTARYCGLIR